MTAEHFGALSLPVGEFLALEHDTEYVALNREVRRPGPGEERAGGRQGSS